MSRYIDADALKDKITDIDGGCAIDGTGFDIYTHEVFELIDEVPTADVRENVRGEWKVCDAKPPTWWYECSVCGKAGNVEYNYCPNCGSEMRKGEDNGDD